MLGRIDEIELLSQFRSHSTENIGHHFRFVGDQKKPTVFDPDGQGAMYLQALADARIFDVTVDPSQKLTGKESAADVLRTAIGLEKDSVAFYVGMKDMVPTELGKDKIDEIIVEEMSHVTILGKELLKLV